MIAIYSKDDHHIYTSEIKRYKFDAIAAIIINKEQNKKNMHASHAWNAIKS